MRGETRRRFLLGVGAGAVAFAGCAHDGAATGEEVPPTEDLMREHGVLDRVLLIYEEALRRMRAPSDPPPDAGVIAAAADVVQRFVVEYHEKLEEDFLFARLAKANQLADLVATLRRQHDAGRALTQIIRGLARATEAGDKRRLARAMQLFVRMYRPHEAREDTVLFPAFRRLVPPGELPLLRERFERRERDLFGEHGFQQMVDRVAGLERELGIHDLDEFTPTAT